MEREDTANWLIDDDEADEVPLQERARECLNNFRRCSARNSPMDFQLPPTVDSESALVEEGPILEKREIRLLQIQ